MQPSYFVSAFYIIYKPHLHLTLLTGCLCLSSSSYVRVKDILQFPFLEQSAVGVSLWFSASDCVWCLPLVSWFEKDRSIHIPDAPFVYFLLYHWLNARQVSAEKFTAIWELGGGGLLARYKRPLKVWQSNLTPTLVKQSKKKKNTSELGCCFGRG